MLLIEPMLGVVPSVGAAVAAGLGHAAQVRRDEARARGGREHGLVGVVDDREQHGHPGGRQAPRRDEPRPGGGHLDDEPVGQVAQRGRAVRAHLLEVDHVLDVHDLHASLVATGLPVVTAHVVVDDSCFGDGHGPRILDQLQECLATHFEVSVAHSTFQIEPASHRTHEFLGHA